MYTDSRGRGLALGGVSLVVMPGQGLRGVRRRVEEDVQRKGRPQMIYVLAGILDLVHKTGSGEVIFVGNVENRVNALEKQMVDMATEIAGVKVVFGTMATMNIARWNIMRHSQGRIQRLRYEGVYGAMQKEINEAVVEINRRVTALNNMRGWKTPFLHSEVCHRRKKGRMRFEYWHLVDGVHPSGKMVGKWSKMIEKTVAQNLLKLEEREEQGVAALEESDSDEGGEERFSRTVAERRD